MISRPRPPLKVVPKLLARPRPDADEVSAAERATAAAAEARDRPSLSEREAEYMAVRARIFGAEAGTGLDDDDAGGPAPAGPAPALCGENGLKAKAELRQMPKGYDPDYNRNISWGISGPLRMPPGGGAQVGGRGGRVGLGQGGRGCLPIGAAATQAAGLFGACGGFGACGAFGGYVSKGPSGPHLPRRRLGEERFGGMALEWKGKYGWIQPDEHIDHPRAAKHQGRIFISVIDLVGTERLVANERVAFYLFEDEAGLGAEECLTAESAMAMAPPLAPPTYALGAASPPMASVSILAAYALGPPLAFAA